MSPLLVVVGTGTGIGKTHFCEALLHRWGVRTSVYGFKPVETGVLGNEGEDERRLRLASTRPRAAGDPSTLRFAPPISPHLAARRAGVVLSPSSLLEGVMRLRPSTEGLVVELAGGLFSPLAPGFTNAHLAKALRAATPTHVILVAPDRLGVLHDIGAVSYAAAALGLNLRGVVLTAPESPDSSTGTNADELPSVTPLPVLATLPRADTTTLAAGQEIANVLTSLSSQA